MDKPNGNHDRFTLFNAFKLKILLMRIHPTTRDSELQVAENPYCPGLPIDSVRDEPEDDAASRVSLVRSIAIWTVVCSLSATPSFIIAFGSMAGNQAAAMVLGIAIFIGIYTSADVLSRKAAFRKNPRIRSVLRSTFIVRTVMVVIFPIATTTDILLGSVSVGLVASASQMMNVEMDNRQLSFEATLATTLVQGCLLSMLLVFIGIFITVFAFVLRSLTVRFKRPNAKEPLVALSDARSGAPLERAMKR